MNPIIKQWDTAKSLKRACQYEEALAIYETLCPKVETELSDNFDKAMFFGDYFGVLADVAQYDKAEAMAAKALKYITENGYTTLNYIFYNYGNMYLHQAKWEEAIPWLEKALNRNSDGWINEKQRAYYGTALGDALFHLGRIEEAEEELLKAVEAGKATVANKDWEPFSTSKKYTSKRVTRN